MLLLASGQNSFSTMCCSSHVESRAGLVPKAEQWTREQSDTQTNTHRHTQTQDVWRAFRSYKKNSDRLILFFPNWVQSNVIESHERETEHRTLAEPGVTHAHVKSPQSRRSWQTPVNSSRLLHFRFLYGHKKWRPAATRAPPPIGRHLPALRRTLGHVTVYQLQWFTCSSPSPREDLPP